MKNNKLLKLRLFFTLKAMKLYRGYKESKTRIGPFIYILLSITFLELVSKKIMIGQLNINIINMLIFTLPIALLGMVLTKLFNKTVNKVILFILTFILCIYYEIQFVFFILFSVPFSFSTIGLADQAFDFVNVINDTVFGNLGIIVTLLLPFIFLIILHKKINTDRATKMSLFTIPLVVITYFSTFLFLEIKDNNQVTNKKLYYNIDDPLAQIDRFGVLTYTRIDIRRQLLGYNTEIETEVMENKPQQTEEEIETIKEYGLNKLDLEYPSSNNKNIQSLNDYVEGSQATNKHQYTGMFEGKNLIFILAEGFNEIAVDEERTPTLYKMIHTGFDFKNFYSPVFLSTTGGEFQSTTGMVPTQEILKLWKSKQPTIYYGLGNAFQRVGYRAQSYHDWTYTYYKRHITMDTLGFSNYMGCGNGLENLLHTKEEQAKIKYGCKCNWLEKDSKMATVTAPLYMGKEGNFVTYYVTVSGHSPYSAGDNIARAHYDQVRDLDYSSPVKYYLAAQIELDKMLEELVNQLEAYGELDNTVIALVGDHYPYTLKIDEMNEPATYKKDSIVEVNHSNFILWNSAMEEPVVVDKVGSQIDVLPTLLNLFGIEYDSRLIVGKDILSDYEGVAIFSNYSWVSDYGTYQAGQKKFYPKDGKELEGETQADYVKRMNSRVRNAFSISKMIVDNDYYKYLLESK